MAEIEKSHIFVSFDNRRILKQHIRFEDSVWLLFVSFDNHRILKQHIRFEDSVWLLLWPCTLTTEI